MDPRNDTYTTHNHSAIWWTLGAIAVLLILWLAFRNMGNPNPTIPNTGVDDASSTDLFNGTTGTSSSTDASSTTFMNAKG